MNQVSIPIETWARLVAASEMLEALRACGVDNWEGYDDALQMLEDKEADD